MQNLQIVQPINDVDRFDSSYNGPGCWRLFRCHCSWIFVRQDAWSWAGCPVGRLCSGFPEVVQQSRWGQTQVSSRSMSMSRSFRLRRSDSFIILLSRHLHLPYISYMIIYFAPYNCFLFYVLFFFFLLFFSLIFVVVVVVVFFFYTISKTAYFTILLWSAGGCCGKIASEGCTNTMLRRIVESISGGRGPTNSQTWWVRKWGCSGGTSVSAIFQRFISLRHQGVTCI